MIQIAMPAFMVCDEPECKAQQPVSLFLLNSGGFAFKPSSGAEWQIILPKGPVSAPFMSRCPLHKIQAPLIQRPPIPGLQMVKP